MGLNPHTHQPEFTDEQMVAACQANAEESGRQRRKWQAEYQNLPPGPECHTARTQIARYTSDEKHWLGLAAFYRDRGVPKPAPAQRPLAVVPTTPPPTVERVTGADDVPNLADHLAAGADDDDDSDPTYDGWR